MPAESYFVFDANVMVSAVLLPRSVPRQAFDKAMSSGRVALSQETANELAEVLSRPHLRKYISEEDRIHFLAELIRNAVVYAPTETITECRDPKDNKYLELAVGVTAACLISGDADLLILGPYRGIPIVTPRQFVDMPPPVARPT